MNTPNILYPSQFANTFMGQRLERHPGPYEISVHWEKDLDQIFPGIVGAQVKPSAAPVYGDMNESETWLLEHLVAWQQPQTAVEFGTFHGRSTLAIAQNSPETARVLTVDLPDETRSSYFPPYSTDDKFVEPDREKVGEQYKGTSFENKISQLYMDATTPEFEQWLDQFLGGDSIDFALVDAAHDFDTTKSLFELAHRKLSPGGIIMTDDYGKINTHIGVTRYFAERAQDLVLYWFNPSEMGENNKPFPSMNKGDPRQSGIFFVNQPEAHREWRLR